MKPDPNQVACDEFYNSLNLDNLPPNHNLQAVGAKNNVAPGPEAVKTEVPQKAPKKRKRVVISCTECHRRKQKCDRQFPCSNCVNRNKQDVCQYENESARKQQLLDDLRSSDNTEYGKNSQVESDSVAKVSALGYAKSNGTHSNTTLGIFKKIEAEVNDGAAVTSHSITTSENAGLREKYKSLIRQLPSRPAIDMLLKTFFHEVNFQYYALDEGTFRDHLRNWNNLSFATLNKGPQELPADLQFFPALLFQCIAMSLLFQPPDHDSSLESLKYAAGMSFDDLAADYSDSGVSILTLLGKRNTTLVTVQAGFVRASYLKYSGMVPESWHSLSQTIKDAQEIELHKDNNQPQRHKPEDGYEHVWHQQLRRRTWLVLALWDIHLALVLGRPTTIDMRDPRPPFPIDAPIPATLEDRRKTPPIVRKSTDMPTPLTMLLWYVEVMAPLWIYITLRKMDHNRAMHSRAENPDTTWDNHPDCYWIPPCRLIFQNGGAFTTMALHRPYICLSVSSRRSALEAGLEILRVQREYFNLLQTKHYKMFNLVLNTFDAIILSAAIYILHPFENRDLLDSTLQHFDWAMERFHTMIGRNPIANTASGVLKAINIRLKKALGTNKPQPSTPSDVGSNPSSTVASSQAVRSGTSISAQSYNSPASSTDPTTISSANSANGSHYNLPTIQNLTSPNPNTTGTWEFQGANNMVPHNFDLSSIAPLQPMHDLIFNDLSTNLGGTNYDLPFQNFQDPNLYAQPEPWQFEGDLGQDSFWAVMNNYNP
ncbi:fungal specific transcription factor domain-containing protein [Botrytis cinerea]